MNKYPQRASLEGLERTIFKLVSEGATREQWAEWLRAPLEHASAQGNLSLVDKLIEAGGNGSAGWKGCGGRTLLHAAAIGGSEGVVTSLLRAGAQPDVNVLPESPSRVSALYMATTNGHEAVARRLVKAGADINFEHPKQRLTVLCEAISGSHELLANDLILRGAEVQGQTSAGSTLLHLAVQQGLERVVPLLLLRNVSKDAVNNDGLSALMFACGAAEGVDPKLTVVDTLLAAGVDLDIRTPEGYSALDWASRTGRVASMQAILRCGVDVNCCDTLGFSALHTAATDDQAAAVDALIEAGADIELKAADGLTPLCSAAEGGLAKSLLALLQHGASVHAQDNFERTPMNLACYFKRKGLETVVDLLLRWDADETTADNDRKTPADALEMVHPGRTCSQEEIERVRLLLSSAPADRVWRRRGWLVMLRTRASRARNGNDDRSGSAGLEGSRAAGGEADGGSKIARLEDATGAASGERGQGSGRMDGSGTEGGGGGKEVLRGAVIRLVGLEPVSVFQTVLEFV